VVVEKAENGLAPGTAEVSAATAAAGKDPSGGGGGAGFSASSSSASSSQPTRLVPMGGTLRASDVIPPDFVLQFETSAALHYKSPTTDELDAYFGDITGVISDLETSILRQLEERVLRYETLLLAVGGRLAELDALAAFAEVAGDFKYVRPLVVEENVLIVKGARHPLAELTVETFVPNDIVVREVWGAAHVPLFGWDRGRAQP
jgi:hypothetical protein